jgi:prepilin-type N-terminal cleavage/methylation domain-containing protein
MKPVAGIAGARLPVPRAHGFSLVEILVVVGILGVLTSIAVVAIPGVLNSSKSSVAQNTLETLNSGLHRFNQTSYELLVPAVPGAGTDELLVLRSLQYRDPLNPIVGTPFVRNDWNPAVSGSTQDYRIEWAGNIFRLLSPGTAGTGLKVNFDGADLGKPYAFPAGYTTAGR